MRILPVLMHKERHEPRCPAGTGNGHRWSPPGGAQAVGYVDGALGTQALDFQPVILDSM